jgi:hypothetical protein
MTDPTISNDRPCSTSKHYWRSIGTMLERGIALPPDLRTGTIRVGPLAWRACFWCALRSSPPTISLVPPRSSRRADELGFRAPRAADRHEIASASLTSHSRAKARRCFRACGVVASVARRRQRVASCRFLNAKTHLVVIMLRPSGPIRPPGGSCSSSVR